MANPLATESNRLGDFLLFEDDYNFTRDAGTLVSGAGNNLKAGTVLGFVGTGTMGTVTFAGTGNGVCTKDATTPVLAGAKEGTYTAKCVLAATDKGLFEVIDPQGKSIGVVNVGATFAREIKFAIADGAPTSWPATPSASRSLRSAASTRCTMQRPPMARSSPSRC
jgi:hypothetical protein